MQYGELFTIQSSHFCLKLSPIITEEGKTNWKWEEFYLEFICGKDPCSDE